jgi:Family of unknown function (DUF5994)
MTATAPPAVDRIALREPVSSTGFVDGGWWPHSADLAAELPALVTRLRDSGLDIRRVSYSIEYWGLAPRRIEVDGRVIRLGGFHQQDPLLVSAVDSRSNAITAIFVVPADTEPARAQRLLTLAAESGGLNRPQRILELAAG